MTIREGQSIPPHQDNCFGCGPRNPAGLHLRMQRNGMGVVADLVLDERHEGAPGLAHGGVVAAALDDLFGGVLVVLGVPAVTANLSVDYRAPVRLGRTLTLSATCTRSAGRKLWMHGTVTDANAITTEATALFVRVGLEHFSSHADVAGPPFGDWIGQARTPSPDGSGASGVR
ncbi:PaaI family thioesterase [Svornostia abyssi]|uniref:Acyl-coenzyme A thioesterase THEM4 n=1 Tax=Svornostia abyssi TaxID=2898438 RepID=A0ABY5PKK8_9ACTN|nr:PaaI family thioesterase [Parviterribacteraceae bacterium J379]